MGFLTAYTKEFDYNLKLAIPVITALLGHTFVQLVDNIMVGQLGTASLAAISLGNSFFWVAMSIGIGFSTAITPLIAETDGQRNSAKGRKVLIHGLISCTFLGVILSISVLLAQPLLYKMGQPEQVVGFAYKYLFWVGISLVPLLIFQAFKQFSDGLSYTKPSMYASLLANIFNVILNYMLIFGNWGAPAMGIEGAAIGTLISRVLALIFMVLYLIIDEKFAPYVRNLTKRGLDKLLFIKIFKLGFPSAAIMFFEVTFFTCAVWLSGLLGKNPQAANQIALNLSSMTFMVAMGLSVASMIRVGNQKGLQNYKELRRIAFSIFLLGILLAIFFALLFFVFHKSLPNIYVDLNDTTNYKDNMEVLSIASNLLLAAAFFQISDSIQVVVLGALRGLQDVKIPTILTFISYWVVGFPVSYFLGKEEMYGSFGIWLGLLAGLTTASVLLFIRFNSLTLKLIKEKQ